MDNIIAISAINDFLFCPRSLYLHSLYSPFETALYHDTPQTFGSITHENIEKQRYTTSKHILQGLPVCNFRLRIAGKIDVYDSKNKYLIERKYRVKAIYKGFKYQLYAQMTCLQEMGMGVKRLFIHSLSDNKRYEIPIPSMPELREFEDTVVQMRAFNSDLLLKHSCSHCNNNIYGFLNW